MKKNSCFYLLLAIFFTESAMAQVSKGQKLLGGNIGIHTKTHSDDQTNELSFFVGPRFGYGLAKNWVLGVDAQYRYGQTSYDDFLAQEINILGADIFVRKFYPMNDRFGIFGEAVAFYGFGDSTDHSYLNPVKIKMQQYSIGVHPGVYYKPNKSFSIEASLGNISYTHIKSKFPNGSDATTNKFDISYTNSLSFGFFFIF